MAGKKFKDLNTTTDIDSLLGVAENSDGITPGNKFTYSKDTTLASPSDAAVPTQGALAARTSYSGTASITLGGITSGTTFTNSAITDVINQLITPYQSPSFTSFSISGISVLEVGQSFPATISFQWTFSHPENVTANTLSIVDNIIAQTILSNISIVSPASFAFSAYPFLYPSGPPNRTSPGNYTFTISAVDTNLQQFTRLLNIIYDWRVHSGMNVNATLTNAQILALANSSLTTTFPTQVVTAGGGYFHYLIPTTFVQPTIFKNHATGFSIDMNAPIVVSVTNAFGIVQGYNDYVSTDVQNNTTTVDVS